jgi:hypothetical protein
MRALWYLLVVVLGAISVMSAISAINLLLGGLTAYGAGQLTGAFVMAVLMFLLARKALAKARAA